MSVKLFGECARSVRMELMHFLTIHWVTFCKNHFSSLRVHSNTLFWRHVLVLFDIATSVLLVLVILIHMLRVLVLHMVRKIWLVSFIICYLRNWILFLTFWVKWMPKSLRILPHHIVAICCLEIAVRMRHGDCRLKRRQAEVFDFCWGRIYHISDTAVWGCILSLSLRCYCSSTSLPSAWLLGLHVLFINVFGCFRSGNCCIVIISAAVLWWTDIVNGRKLLIGCCWREISNGGLLIKVSSLWPWFNEVLIVGILTIDPRFPTARDCVLISVSSPAVLSILTSGVFTERIFFTAKNRRLRADLRFKHLSHPCLLSDFSIGISLLCCALGGLTKPHIWDHSFRSSWNLNIFSKRLD